MDSIEFHCQQCDTLLRVKQQDQAKLIRCPNCEHLQRYVDRESFRAVESNKAEGTATADQFSTLPEEAWSLRTATGREIHGLSRSEFEHLLLQGHADTQAYFIGGDFRQWTPVQKLFQSATGRVKADSSSGIGSPSAPPAYQPRPAQPRPTSAYRPPNTALPMEQQLPDGYGTYVMILGFVSIVTFCIPLVGITGLVLGTVDAIRLGNGDISGRYKNRLVIGILCCLFSVFLYTCTGWRFRF